MLAGMLGQHQLQQHHPNRDRQLASRQAQRHHRRCSTAALLQPQPDVSSSSNSSSSSSRNPAPAAAAALHQAPSSSTCPSAGSSRWDAAPQAAPGAAGGVLGVAALTTPAAMHKAWQTQVLPACVAAWQQLAADSERAAEAGAAAAAAATDDDADDEKAALEQQQLDAIADQLARLDVLLGTCQQVTLVSNLLQQHHARPEWRSAAARVFVEARTLEQEVCADARLQRGLMCCLAQLVSGQDQRQDQQQQQQMLLLLRLARTLFKHVQLEAPNPWANAPAGSSVHATAQVLSETEQGEVLARLQAVQKDIVSRMQAVLAADAAAPVLHDIDPESLAALLEPLQAAARGDGGNAAAAAPAAAAADLEAVLAAAGVVGSASAPAAVVDGLRLTLPLVTRVLQLHIDCEVRAAVYAAGVLPRLERLLHLWGELAEVRRRIAAMQGASCHADVVLQHSLLGPALAARACADMSVLGRRAAQGALPALARLSEQQAAVDTPDCRVDQLRALFTQQQQQQQQASLERQQHQQQAGVSAADLAHLMHTAQQRLLSPQHLAKLAPFLQLPRVLRGASRVLEAVLGVSLSARQARGQECWAPHVLVYDLLQQQQQTTTTDHTQQAAPDLLGTIFIDCQGSYSVQLVCYGAGYPALQQTAAGCSAGQGHGSNSNSSSVGEQASSPAFSSAAPAVALGLQSGGLLCGSFQQLSLGLWELCHELGHAVNFILSAHAGTHSSSSSGQQPGAACHTPLYHEHAAWLPLEAVELPSSLFEALVTDAGCLQQLLRDDGGALPDDLADRLAAFMWLSHHNPFDWERLVLAMQFDLRMCAIDSKQLGRHAAHAAWTETMAAGIGHPNQQAMIATLPQLAAVPRLLAAGGQGYGYAVAARLAQLLQPELQATVRSGTLNSSDAQQQQRREVWWRLLSAGSDLADAVWLADMVMRVQAAVACGRPGPAAGQDEDGTVSSSLQHRFDGGSTLPAATAAPSPDHQSCAALLALLDVAEVVVGVRGCRA